MGERGKLAIVPCESYAPETVRAALLEVLEPLGGLEWVRPGMRVGIKLNLCAARKPEAAATTHPVMAAELTRLLRERGAGVVLGDSPGEPFTGPVLSRVYAAAGLAAFALDSRGQGGLSQDVGVTDGTTIRGHIIRGLDDPDPDKLYYRAVFLDTAQTARIVMAMDDVEETRVGAAGGHRRSRRDLWRGSGGFSAERTHRGNPALPRKRLHYRYFRRYGADGGLYLSFPGQGCLSRLRRCSDPFPRRSGAVSFRKPILSVFRRSGIAARADGIRRSFTGPRGLRPCADQGIW